MAWDAKKKTTFATLSHGNGHRGQQKASVRTRKRALIKCAGSQAYVSRARHPIVEAILVSVCVWQPSCWLSTFLFTGMCVRATWFDTCMRKWELREYGSGAERKSRGMFESSGSKSVAKAGRRSNTTFDWHERLFLSYEYLREKPPRSLEFLGLHLVGPKKIPQNARARFPATKKRNSHGRASVGHAGTTFWVSCLSCGFICHSLAVIAVVMVCDCFQWHAQGMERGWVVGRRWELWVANLLTESQSQRACVLILLRRLLPSPTLNSTELLWA